MKEYIYKVAREYPDGRRASKLRTITRFKPLTVGGLYVRLGKGYPGMQRVISEAVREIED